MEPIILIYALNEFKVTYHNSGNFCSSLIMQMQEKKVLFIKMLFFECELALYSGVKCYMQMFCGYAL